MNEYTFKYTIVNNYYKNGLWNKIMVQNAIGKWITEEEYKEIIGEDDMNGD